MVISVSGLLSSSDMESVLEVGRDNQLLSAKSQDNIDATERMTDKIVNEWKAVSKQVEGLKLYNEQKRIQIQAQLDLMDKLDDQLVQVVVMQRQIPPLAQRMLESLESFIALDTPFRIEERQNRIDLVRSSLAKPKVTASEQVRQVLEAYNIEAEYGRKIDTYESTLLDGKSSAQSSAPKNTYWRRRPNRLRVLSEILPINGSVSASRIRGSTNAQPISFASMPIPML